MHVIVILEVIYIRQKIILSNITINIVAAFGGMHVSPAKHSYVRLPRKCDYQESVTTGQTDGQTDADECMCRLRNIAMCDYQESVTTGRTDRRQTK